MYACIHVCNSLNFNLGYSLIQLPELVMALYLWVKQRFLNQSFKASHSGDILVKNKETETTPTLQNPVDEIGVRINRGCLCEIEVENVHCQRIPISISSASYKALYKRMDNIESILQEHTLKLEIVAKI